MLHKPEWISLDHAIHVNSDCSLIPKCVIFVTEHFKYRLIFYKILTHFVGIGFSSFKDMIPNNIQTGFCYLPSNK